MHTLDGARSIGENTRRARAPLDLIDGHDDNRNKKCHCRISLQWADRNGQVLSSDSPLLWTASWLSYLRNFRVLMIDASFKSHLYHDRPIVNLKMMLRLFICLCLSLLASCTSMNLTRSLLLSSLMFLLKWHLCQPITQPAVIWVIVHSYRFLIYTSSLVCLHRMRPGCVPEWAWVMLGYIQKKERGRRWSDGGNKPIWQSTFGRLTEHTNSCEWWEVEEWSFAAWAELQCKQ